MILPGLIGLGYSLGLIGFATRLGYRDRIPGWTAGLMAGDAILGLTWIAYSNGRETNLNSISNSLCYFFICVCNR